LQQKTPENRRLADRIGVEGRVLHPQQKVYPRGCGATYEQVRKQTAQLIGKLQEFWTGQNGPEVDPDDHEERKAYALAAQEFEPAEARHLLFSRLSGDIIDFREGVRKMDTDSLATSLKHIQASK